MYNSVIALDQLAQAQAGHATTANQLFAAASPAMLFGIKQSTSSGLLFTLYGGNFPIAGVPTLLADQAVTLTASTTNYIYATSSGVVTKTTSIPGSWPGPLAAGATALYTLVTSATGITSGTNHRVGIGLTGTAGPAGAQGNPGTDLITTRTRVWEPIGGGSLIMSGFGNDPAAVTGTATAATLGSGSLRASIPYLSFVGSAVAGTSVQVHSPRNFAYLGNAAGRGGFTLGMRFCMESATSPANQRSFFGMFAPVTIANAEPDAVVNMIGIGANAGDANFRIYHNDATGTATKTAFATPGNFPARGTDNVYELLLQSVANSGTVTGSLTCADTGATENFSYSSDIPANTVFMTWVMWTNNGVTASAASFGAMQVISQTRY